MKFSFGKLLLVFTIIPFIELSILLKLASATSVMTTLVIIVITGVVGAYFAKQQGMIVIKNIQNETNNGSIPGNELMHGLCVLIGGLLLLTPGILTDLFGFSLLFPLTRYFYIKTGTELFKNKVSNGSVAFYSNMSPGGRPHMNTNTKTESRVIHEEDDDLVKFD